MPSSSASASSKLICGHRLGRGLAVRADERLRHRHGSLLRQHLQVRHDAARQGRRVIAALEDGDDAALAVAVGEPAQLARHPGEVVLDQRHAGQRVVGVGVEAGRDQDQLRPPAVDRRQHVALDHPPPRLAAGAGRQRPVEDVALDAALADAWPVPG